MPTTVAADAPVTHASLAADLLRAVRAVNDPEADPDGPRRIAAWAVAVRRQVKRNAGAKSATSPAVAMMGYIADAAKGRLESLGEPGEGDDVDAGA